MVPPIIGAALDYARHGGARHWLLLLATPIAALAFAASALFVAPAASALGPARAWSADRCRTRPFRDRLLACSVRFASACFWPGVPLGPQLLVAVSPPPCPG